MAANSKIEWTRHTFNPWWGCTKVSPACDHCYAEAWARRFGQQLWGATAPRRFLSENYWAQPLKWDRAAHRAGRRAMVFCASMADVFEWGGDLSKVRARLWALIEETPHLDWLLLTKRPHLVQRLTPWKQEWPRNVWVGTTAENQRFAAKRIPHLIELPCAYRFISCEPLLGAVDITSWQHRLDWVIAGGESGPHARRTEIAWVRELREQCRRAGVAFHFKQWGGWLPKERLMLGKQVISYTRMSKHEAGRELDGHTWDELPHNYDIRIARALGLS